MTLSPLPFSIESQIRWKSLATNRGRSLDLSSMKTRMEYQQKGGYQTGDGGNTWMEGNNQIKEELQSVVYYDEISAWAVGKDGTIIKHRWDITHTTNSVPAPSIVLFPNPAQRQVQIRVSDGQPLTQVQVYDIAGRLVATKNVNNENEITLSLQNYSPGTYFIRSQLGEQFIVKQFIKE